MEAATKVPAYVPTRMPTAMYFTTFQSTPPRLWWARALDMAVNMILPRDVPMAMWMATS